MWYLINKNDKKQAKRSEDVERRADLHERATMWTVAGDATVRAAINSLDKRHTEFRAAQEIALRGADSLGAVRCKLAEKSVLAALQKEIETRNVMVEAIAGNMVLNAITSSFDVAAADLNGPPASPIVLTVQVAFRTSATGETHRWYNGAATVSASKGDVADVGIVDPTVSADPAFVNGLLEYTLTLDDGPTYVAGETMTTTVQISADDTLLGKTVTQLVIDINIV